MSKYWDEKEKEPNWWLVFRDASITTIAAIALGMWGCPMYNVWEQGLRGEAELSRAVQNRKIKVQEAEAIKDSAKLLAEAEVQRAIGNSKANDIIAGGLGGAEGYLRYLWIHAISETKEKQIIYVPTEAGLPILEAGKRP